MPRLLSLILAVTCVLAAPAAADAAPATGAARSWSPLRMHIVCQGWGRTKACPAFLRGFIDETPLIDFAPRASAQVILFYNVTFRALDDIVHLRFTSTLAKAPKAYELTQTVSSRGTDDEQRNQLRPAFLRGAGVFVAVAVPGAVKVVLKPPAAVVKKKNSTTPWGFNMWAGGNGSWTRQFKSANSWGGLGFSRKSKNHRLHATFGVNYSLSRQPPLIIDDEEISLDVDSYAVTTRVLSSWNVSPHWSVGGVARGGGQDSEGRYKRTGRLHVGASYDRFTSDDPRGNVLAVAYLVGYQYDRYHLHNVLNETRAHFPSHGALAIGSVRKDKMKFGLNASVFSQMFAPRTRYVVTVSPSVELQLGPRVDLSFSFGITKQAVPGPRDINAENFEEVTRASYAEPLRLNTWLNLNIHWDRTDSGRNNRWDVVFRAGEINTL